MELKENDRTMIEKISGEGDEIEAQEKTKKTETGDREREQIPKRRKKEKKNRKINKRRWRKRKTMAQKEEEEGLDGRKKMKMTEYDAKWRQESGDGRAKERRRKDERESEIRESLNSRRECGEENKRGSVRKIERVSARYY